MKEELNLALIAKSEAPSVFTFRDCAAVGFRQKRTILTIFLTIFGLVTVITWLLPFQYESEAEILVKRERVDPVVTADKNGPPLAQPDLTEQDLNSEVEILKSHDLLEKVAIQSGLSKKIRESRLKSFLIAMGWMKEERPAFGQDLHTTMAARQLEKDLQIEPLKKTRMIKVSYRSTEAQLSVAVLQTFVRLYLEKHLEVHRMPGAVDFFQAQVDQYRKQLEDAQTQLKAFGASNQVVSPPLEKELVVRRLADFNGDFQQTRAAIIATEKRIQTLTELQSSRPARLTSQVKTADNPMLLQQMKSTLLTLQLKRTELLSKYAEDYPSVKEVDAEIAQATEALSKAESSPTREEVTDRDATHEWLTGEITKAQAELTGLRARLVSTASTISDYRKEAQHLNNSEIGQLDVVRNAKTAEENYVLYTKKLEEARITEALDQKRIINVSVAEQPTLPSTPVSPIWSLNILLGALLASLASVGFGLLRDYLDPSFRTPNEVENLLSIPVLASLSVESGERTS
jgi:uncharacterized protein involved in exopolysaccharide biosynthesis